MALTPDRGEIFLQEVEENYRRDRMQDLAKTYGKWIIAAVILFLAAVGGWIWWQNRLAQQTAEQSEELSRVFNDIGQEKLTTVPRRLQELETARNDVVKAAALLTQAALALDKNDRATALAKYRAVADDGGLPQPYRNLATVRLTTLEFDQLKPEQVIARLEPLAKPGNPWFGSAGELTAMAYLKQNRRTEAGRLFAAIAADRQVPESIRSRAVQIAGTLGIDASASLPMMTQQDPTQ